ncbi:LuxR C-terminal-related transcriptional regulator [Serratia sp. L9]|uniref:LuxR C-terminal-related transcriptional regulator n=1 Tax=Serratia sp. L9 TaxID=3423946 RepID=UPI003D67D89D
MADLDIYTISNDRYFCAGLRFLLLGCEELAHKAISMKELPFEKDSFECRTIKKLKKNACDILILDCSCGFINYYSACSTLYSALERGVLYARVILFYENSLCLTNPDMYNHFVTLDKNTSVGNILLLFTRLSLLQKSFPPDNEDAEESISIQQCLTGRELVVINEIYNGASPSEIANKLKLRLKTINSYKNKAMKKINTKRALDFQLS